MQYMLVIYESESDFAKRTDPAHADEYWSGWKAYFAAVGEAGIMVSGNALEHASTATTVTTKGGARQVQDGPFVDTKEQLGGYFIVDVPDLDVALDWAARSPAAATGAMEIRPVLVMNEGE